MFDIFRTLDKKLMDQKFSGCVNFLLKAEKRVMTIHSSQESQREENKE